MAKHEIKHTCGHTKTHQIYGTNVNGERDRKVEWLSSRLCKDCYADTKAKEIKENSVRFPNMKGTEKQVAWAISIMSKVETGLEDIKKQFAGNQPAISAIEYIENIKYAAFWIDYRECDALDMLRKFSGSGLSIRGKSHSHIAKVDKNGKITVSWSEIISDGKGGYQKTFTKEV